MPVNYARQISPSPGREMVSMAEPIRLWLDRIGVSRSERQLVLQHRADQVYSGGEESGERYDRKLEDAFGLMERDINSENYRLPKIAPDQKSQRFLKVRKRLALQLCIWAKIE